MPFFGIRTETKAVLDQLKIIDRMISNLHGHLLDHLEKDKLEELSEKVNAFIVQNPTFDEIQSVYEKIDTTLNRLGKEIAEEYPSLSEDFTRKFQAFDQSEEMQKVRVSLQKVDAAFQSCLNRFESHCQAKDLKKINSEKTRAELICNHLLKKPDQALAVIRGFKSYGIKDKNERLRIALICAKSYPYELLNDIRNFAIEGEESLTDVALECLDSGKYQNVDKLLALKIMKENNLFKIAFKFAQLYPGYLPSHIHKFNIQDQKKLTDIAMLCAKKHLKTTAEYFQSFKITDPECLYKLVWKCALMNPKETAYNISNFKVTVYLREDQLFEIAMLCAQKHPKCLVFFNLLLPEKKRIAIAKECAKGTVAETVPLIKKFGITDQAGLISIAMLCAEKDPEITVKYIQYFNITNQDDLVKIAMLCAEKDPEITVKYIQFFNITNQDDLIKIAMLCAESVPVDLARNIQKFKIQDQHARIAIAQKCADKDLSKTIGLIENFGITDQDYLVTFATKAAKSAPAATIDNILGFNINNQDDLAKIEMLCAESVPVDLTRNIQTTDQARSIAIAKQYVKTDEEASPFYISSLKIQDQKELAEIAMLCEIKNPEKTASFFNGFGISNPKYLYKLVKKCALKSPNEIARHISHFKFAANPEQDKLFEIAMLCAQGAPADLAQTIQNFEIKDQHARFAIAQECARRSPVNTIYNIKKFNITNQGDLVQIAMLCAEKDPAVTVRYIQLFNITNQDDLVQIAMLCAEKDPAATVKDIQCFNIADQEDLIKIAMLCAESVPVDLARNIQKFKIQDQHARIAIAQKCAEKDLSKTIGLIENFGITDQDYLVTFAMLCAERAPVDLARSIQEFKIQDQNARIAIAEKCAQTAPAETINSILDFEITNQTHLLEFAMKCTKNAPIAILKHLQNFAILGPENLNRIYENALTQIGQNETLKVEFAVFLYSNNSIEKINELKANEPVIKEILENSQVIIGVMKKGVSMYKIASITDVEIMKCTEKAQPYLANLKKSEVSPTEIPDIEYNPRNATVYADLLAVFDELPRTQAENKINLNGVLDIGNNPLTAEMQKSNLAHFVHLVQHKVNLTGINNTNRMLFYGLIERVFKHLLTAWPNLSLADKITYITQFSSIGEGVCITPRLKAAQMVYNSLYPNTGMVLDEASQFQYEIQSLIDTLRENALSMAYQNIQNVSARSSIDTHTDNLVRYSFKEAGFTLTTEDVYMKSVGLRALRDILHSDFITKEKALKVVKNAFWKAFVEIVFPGIQKLITSKLKIYADLRLFEGYFNTLMSKKEVAELREIESSSTFPAREYAQVLRALKGKTEQLKSAQNEFDNFWKVRARKTFKEKGVEKFDRLSKKDQQIAFDSLDQKDKKNLDVIHQRQILLSGELDRLKEKEASLKQTSAEVAQRVADIVESTDHEIATLHSEYLLLDETDYSTYLSPIGAWKILQLILTYDIPSTLQE